MVASRRKACLGMPIGALPQVMVIVPPLQDWTQPMSHVEMVSPLQSNC